FAMENTWGFRLGSILRLPERKEISVIVLIHNNASLIDRCIRSLKINAAKYSYEIIIVDNASSDGGAEIVRRNHPDIRVVANGRHGCASGRNLGVSVSSGKYVAFFDSDQWITSEFGFLEALELLDRHAEIGAVSWAAGWVSPRNGSLGGPIVDYLPARGTGS